MIPKVVLFSEPAIAWLRRQARVLGVPTSEFVRRIVDTQRKVK